MASVTTRLLLEQRIFGFVATRRASRLIKKLFFFVKNSCEKKNYLVVFFLFLVGKAMFYLLVPLEN